MWHTRQYENIVNFLSSEWYVACELKVQIIESIDHGFPDRRLFHRRG
jgi:hypothetical protein